MKWCWRQCAVTLKISGESFCPVLPNACGSCCGVTAKRKVIVRDTCLLICRWLFCKC